MIGLCLLAIIALNIWIVIQATRNAATPRRHSVLPDAPPYRLQARRGQLFDLEA